MARPRKYHTKADIEEFFSEAASYGVKVSEEKAKNGYIVYHWSSRRSAKFHNRVFKHIAVFLLAQKEDFYLEDNLDIDHINGDKTDNRLENLRLVTQRENTIKGMTFDNPDYKSNLKAAMNRPEVKEANIRINRSKSVLWQNKDKVIEAYLAGESMCSIAKCFRTSHTPVQKFLKANNIQLRNERK